MVAKKDKDGAEIVCEFFGIEITTKNPRVAKVLTSDVHDILNTEITSFVGKRSSDESEEAELDAEAAFDPEPEPEPSS